MIAEGADARCAGFAGMGIGGGLAGDNEVLGVDFDSGGEEELGDLRLLIFRFVRERKSPRSSKDEAVRSSADESLDSGSPD